MEFLPSPDSVDAVFDQYDKTAKTHVHGRRFEPRVYFQEYVFADDQRMAFPDPVAWRNGEQFPVVITHITAAMRGSRIVGDEQNPREGSPVLINNYGLRINSHDTFYQSPQMIQLPAWHNVRNASSDVVTPGTTTWVFDKPFLLGNRASFKVQVKLERAPVDAQQAPSQRLVGVVFDCLGKITGRPYRLADTRDVDDTSIATFSSSRLQNQVAEPLEVLSVTFTCGSEQPGYAGDITQMRVRISCDGTGSNQSWSHGGGVTPFPHEFVPATLLGVTSGICVTHRIPGAGWLFDPGQGVDPAVEFLYLDLADRVRTTEEAVMIGMLGYTVIT